MTFRAAAGWSRDRAIQHSATLIAEIESFRHRRGHYPISLQSLNRDVPTGVVGIERLHYEPNGEGYNLFFVRPHIELDAREVVVFNPRDEHRFTSHELDILQYDGDQLDRRRGDRRRTRLAHPIGYRSFSIEEMQTVWYAYDWLWRLRGFLELLVGGVGVRRGRPAPEDLHDGDALDFWRIEAYEPGRRLRLSAEMKLPGRAWLDFEVVPRAGGATIRQTALFDPVGLFGLVYWYGVYPLHRLVFSGMLQGIARAATRRPRSEPRG